MSIVERPAVTEKVLGRGEAEEGALLRQSFVRRTLLDYAIYLPAMLAQAVGGVVTAAVISKLSTPSDFGNYTLGVNTMMVLSLLAGLWLNEAVIRFWAEARHQGWLPRLYSTLLFLGFNATWIVGVLAWVVLLLLRQRLDAEMFRYLVAAVACFPLVVAFGAVRSLSRASGRSLVFSGLLLWRVIGGLGIGLAFALLLRAGALGFLLGLGAAFGLVVLVFAIKARRTLWMATSPAQFSPALAVNTLRYGLPLTGNGIAALVLDISDRYIIGGFLSAYEVGIYALGYSIAYQGMLLITDTFSAAMEPVIYQAWEAQSVEESRRLIEQLARYLGLAVIPVAAGLTLLSRPVVILFSTPEYADGALVVGPVCAAMICSAFATLYGRAFSLNKRTTPLFVLFAIAGVFNIIVNVITVPRFGFMAAAWSTLASYTLLLAMTAFWSRRLLVLRLRGAWVWKAGVGAIGMALVVRLIERVGQMLPGGAVLILQAVGGALAYGLLLIILRAVTVSELSSVWRLITSRFAKA